MKNKIGALAFAVSFVLPSISAYSLSAPPSANFVVVADAQSKQPMCSAQGHQGLSVAEAIRNCVGSGQIQSQCAQSVSCSDGISMCAALGYAGDSADAAVQQCVANGHSTESQCAQSVSCSPSAALCQARGYTGSLFAGSSVQSAIQRCDLGGNTRALCAANVSCSANVPFCTAKGYAGDSFQGAVQECGRDNGQSCDKNVVCSGAAQP